MWVRLPPRAPVFLLCYQLVEDFVLAASLLRTLPLDKRDRVVCQSSLDIRFQLLSPRADKGIVVLFSYSDTSMPE